MNPFELYKTILLGDPAALATLGITPPADEPLGLGGKPPASKPAAIDRTPPAEGPLSLGRPGASLSTSSPAAALKPQKPAAPTAPPEVPGGPAAAQEQSLSDLARELAKMQPADRDALMSRKAGFMGASSRARYRDAQAFEREQRGENPYQVTPENASKQVEHYIHFGGPRPTRADVWEKAGVTPADADRQREELAQRNRAKPRASNRAAGDFERAKSALAGEYA